MRVIIVMALLFVLFLGVVYGAISATGHERVDMNGKILGICNDNLQTGNNLNYSILVEGTINGASENQNISVRITKNTTIVRKHGDTTINASLNELKPGQRIEIKFMGSLLQTYPPQTNASQITILY